MLGFIVVNMLCGCLYVALKRKHSLSLTLISFLSIGHHRKSHFYITVCSRGTGELQRQRGSEVMNTQISFTKVKIVEHSFGVNRRTFFIERWPIASVLPAVGGYG